MMNGLDSNGRPYGGVAHSRMSGGHAARDEATPPPPPPSIGAANIVRTLRRRARTIVVIGAVGTALAAYVVHRSEPYYRATAVIRLADERRSLVGDMERADPDRGRLINPL